MRTARPAQPDQRLRYQAGSGIAIPEAGGKATRITGVWLPATSSSSPQPRHRIDIESSSTSAPAASRKCLVEHLGQMMARRWIVMAGAAG